MEIQVSGDGNRTAGCDYVSVTLGDPKPESQLQAEFAERTGIWCPKPVREFFEHLMYEHGFVAKDLALAWSQQSIKWDSEAGRVKISAPLIEAVFGWGVAAAMLAYFLALVVPVVFKSTSLEALAVFVVGTMMYGGGLWMAGRFILWPRRTALRVRKVLEREGLV